MKQAEQQADDKKCAARGERSSQNEKQISAEHQLFGEVTSEVFGKAPRNIPVSQRSRLPVKRSEQPQGSGNQADENDRNEAASQEPRRLVQTQSERVAGEPVFHQRRPIEPEKRQGSRDSHQNSRAILEWLVRGKGQPSRYKQQSQHGGAREKDCEGTKLKGRPSQLSSLPTGKPASRKTVSLSSFRTHPAYFRLLPATAACYSGWSCSSVFQSPP